MTEQATIAEPKEEVKGTHRPDAAVDLPKEEHERLARLTDRERYEEGRQAQARAKAILDEAYEKNATHPNGYDYNFSKCEKGDAAYEEFIKNQGVIDLCHDLNSKSKQNKRMEDAVNKHIPHADLPQKHAGLAIANGEAEDLCDFFVKNGDGVPKNLFAEDYDRNEHKVIFAKNINPMKMIQNVVSTGAGASMGSPAVTSTQGITTFVPRSMDDVIQVRKLMNMYSAQLKVERLTQGNGFSYLVETHTYNTTPDPAVPNAATADDNKMSGRVEGSTYPEQDFQATTRTIQVKTCGFIARATREQMDDVQQFQRFMTDTLGRRAMEYINNIVINGNGSANQPTGLLNITGPAVINKTNTQTRYDFYNDVYKIFTGPRALVSGQTVTYGAAVEPDALVLHSYECARLRAEKDSDGRYLASFPTENNMGARVWGIPIIPTHQIDVNKGFMVCNDNISILVKDGLEIEHGYTQGDWERDISAVKYRIRLNVIMRRPHELIKLGTLNVEKS